MTNKYLKGQTRKCFCCGKKYTVKKTLRGIVTAPEVIKQINCDDCNKQIQKSISNEREAGCL
jgi:hypothetical protein